MMLSMQKSEFYHTFDTRSLCLPAACSYNLGHCVNNSSFEVPVDFQAQGVQPGHSGIAQGL